MFEFRVLLLRPFSVVGQIGLSNHGKFREPNLPYYLPTARKRMAGFILFTIVLTQ